MSVLTRASEELFRRGDDERFESLEALVAHCRAEKRLSEDRWQWEKASSVTDPIELRVKGRSAEAVIHDVLRQAEEKGRSGDVAQYLVGVKLNLRLESEVSVVPSNKRPKVPVGYGRRDG